MSVRVTDRPASAPTKAEMVEILTWTILALAAAPPTFNTTEAGAAGSYHWINLRNFILGSMESGLWDWIGHLREGAVNRVVEALESGETCFQNYFQRCSWLRDGWNPVDTAEIVARFRAACREVV